MFNGVTYQNLCDNEEILQIKQIPPPGKKLIKASERNQPSSENPHVLWKGTLRICIFRGDCSIMKEVNQEKCTQCRIVCRSEMEPLIQQSSHVTDYCYILVTVLKPGDPAENKADRELSVLLRVMLNIQRTGLTLLCQSGPTPPY